MKHFNLLKTTLLLCALIVGSLSGWADYTKVMECDLTSKSYGASNYNTSTDYGDWTIVNGANNNKGWTYFKMGGKPYWGASFPIFMDYIKKAFADANAFYNSNLFKDFQCPADSLILVDLFSRDFIVINILDQLIHIVLYLFTHAGASFQGTGDILRIIPICSTII